MPTDDQQVLVTGSASAPASFTIPGNGQIQPKAIFASYDGTGAAGDFLPAIKIVSDAGEIVGIYPTETAVVAGASADVSWFPGVKPLPPSTAVHIYPVSALLASCTQTIGSGAVAAISFTGFTWAPGLNQAFVTPGGGGFSTLTWANAAEVICTLIVDWPTAAYDRYIEFAIANPTDANYSNSPRIREGATPDGDRLTLTAHFVGLPGPPATTLTCNVFQASGVNRNITAQLFVRAIPLNPQ